MKKHSNSQISSYTTPTMLLFVGGGVDDPLPLASEAGKRFGRCLTHNCIVQFSKTLLRWVYDDGTFHHTGCHIEIPKEWLPNPIANQEALAEARRLLNLEGQP